MIDISSGIWLIYLSLFRKSVLGETDFLLLLIEKNMKKNESLNKFNIPFSIQKIIKDYVYGMNEANEKKILKIFNIESNIVGFFDDETHLINEKEFSKFISKQKPLSKEQLKKLKYEIIHYEVSNNDCILFIDIIF